MAVKKKSNTGKLFAIIGAGVAFAVITGFRKGTVETGKLEYFGYDPFIFSAYYTKDQVNKSDRATADGIINKAGSDDIVRASYLAQMVLDPITDYLGEILLINGWFRSPALNAAVGGASDSDHLRGEAADVESGTGDNTDIIKSILDLYIPFDQMVIYDSMDNPSRIHLSYNAAKYPDEQLRRVLFKNSSGDYQDITYQDLSNRYEPYV